MQYRLCTRIKLNPVQALMLAALPRARVACCLRCGLALHQLFGVKAPAQVHVFVEAGGLEERPHKRFVLVKLGIHWQ